MSTCNIDHSKQDVLNKLISQKTHLPAKIYREVESYVSRTVAQRELNEVFHLLKKYDLVSTDEQLKRNQKIANIVQ